MLKAENVLAVDWLNRQQPGINKKDRQVENNEVSGGVHCTGHVDYKPGSRVPAVESVDEALNKSMRLCWVWNNDQGRYLAIISRVQKVHNWRQYIDTEGRGWQHARLADREGIEKYLGDK